MNIVTYRSAGGHLAAYLEDVESGQITGVREVHEKDARNVLDSLLDNVC